MTNDESYWKEEYRKAEHARLTERERANRYRYYYCVALFVSVLPIINVVLTWALRQLGLWQ